MAGRSQDEMRLVSLRWCGKCTLRDHVVGKTDPTLDSTPTDTRKMLYKTLIAAFCISSGDALRIDGLNTRRSAVTSAAAAISLVPLAAFAELKKAGDAEIYKRADDGKLNAARVRTPISTN